MSTECKNTGTTAVPHSSQCKRQQEAEQIKTLMLILVWRAFPESQLTELTGKLREHHTEPCELHPAGVFCSHSLLTTVLPPDNAGTGFEISYKPA